MPQRGGMRRTVLLAVFSILWTALAGLAPMTGCRSKKDTSLCAKACDKPFLQDKASCRKRCKAGPWREKTMKCRIQAKTAKEWFGCSKEY